MPARSLDRQASLELPVNFRVRVFLVRTIVLAPANPRAYVVCQALLDVHAKTRLHTRGAYIGQSGRAAEHCRVLHGLPVVAHGRAVPVKQYADLAVPSRNLMVMLRLEHIAVILERAVTKLQAVRLARLQETADPERPVVVVVLERPTPGV